MAATLYIEIDAPNAEAARKAIETSFYATEIDPLRNCPFTLRSALAFGTANPQLKRTEFQAILFMDRAE